MPRRRRPTAPQVTSELADLAEKAAAQAAAVLRNGRRALLKALSGRVRGGLRRAPDELAVTIGRTATIVTQTRTRLAGQIPDSAARLAGQIPDSATRLAGQIPDSATRLVSLPDPDAQPIHKGRIGRPVEFGVQGPGHRQR